MEQFVRDLADPNLAFVLLLAGLVLLALEVFSPGGIGGIAGIAMLAAAIAMLVVLPTNIAGVVLIVVAVAFFALEANSPGIGIFTGLAAASLAFGGLYLFDTGARSSRVSPYLVGGSVAGLAVFFGLTVQALVRARRMPKPEVLPPPGTEGVAVRPLAPSGVVRAMGEEWTAETRGAHVGEGERVRVVEAIGLTLVVEPVERGVTTGGTT